MLDQSIAEFANRIAQHQPGRLLALVAAIWLLAVPVLALLCRPSVLSAVASHRP